MEVEIELSYRDRESFFRKLLKLENTPDYDQTTTTDAMNWEEMKVFYEY
jgi:hypothetical protein